MEDYKKIRERSDKNKEFKIYYTESSISYMFEDKDEKQVHEPLYITGDRLELLSCEICDIFLDTRYRFAIYNVEENGEYVQDDIYKFYVTVDAESGEVKGSLSGFYIDLD